MLKAPIRAGPGYRSSFQTTISPNTVEINHIIFDQCPKDKWHRIIPRHWERTI